MPQTRALSALVSLMRMIQQGQTRFALPDFESAEESADFERIIDGLLYLRDRLGWATFPDPMPNYTGDYCQYRQFVPVRLTAAGERALAGYAV